MARRQYSNTATEATLTGGVAAADPSFTLDSFAGYPAAPFTATISRGEADEEVVLVTAVSASTVTAQRGYDGTASKSHAAGATFIHTTIAKDFDEANDHVNKTTGVHGLIGALVGTSDAQTLSNKTLLNPTLTGATVTGTAALVNATFSGTIQVTGATTLNAVTAATGSFSGAVTIGGTLTVTGLAKAGSLESTGGLVLAQIADPGGTVSKETVWAKADGLYRRTGTGAVVRMPVHWGTGTAYPANAVVGIGDTIVRTDLASALMRYHTSGWRQVDAVTVANAATRTALPTASLHVGFSARESDTGLLYEYTASGWGWPQSRPMFVQSTAPASAPDGSLWFQVN